MPAKKILINLIGEEEMEHTPIGRIVTWAVTYGRYIMIGTEIVVLLAFISRFSLDRKLTDLKEEVTEKQAIIEANIDFEKDFRNTQGQLTQVKTLLALPATTLNALTTVQSLLPSDVRLDSLDISAQSISANVIAGTTNGFSQFVSQLGAASIFQQVEIGEVRRSPFAGIQFSFSAKLAKTK